MEHIANLSIYISKEACNFAPCWTDGKQFFRVWFRAKPQWDGLCEKWWFFVHPTGKKIVTENDEQESYRVVRVLGDAVETQSMETDED